MPTVSIVVPVYKAEKTMDACVESILAQTFPDFELLLIDDERPARPARATPGCRPPRPLG